tara:strand:- start:14934 stop:15428 length:495 start_codon:yes stop_codon:yes gene_type:complete
MAVPTPSGLWSLNVDRLRSLVAGTDAFQAWTSTADAATAKGYIHAYTINFEDNSQTTYAAIGHPIVEFGGRSGPGLGIASYVDELSIDIPIAFFAVVAEQDEERAVTFDNSMHDILSDMLATESAFEITAVAQIPEEELPHQWRPATLPTYVRAFVLNNSRKTE